MLLHDGAIKHKAIHEGMIDPFVDRQESRGGPSWGLSSYGYDMRLSRKIKCLNRVGRRFPYSLDPKSHLNMIQEEVWMDTQISGFIDINPGEFILGQSLERFRIPSNVLGKVEGKSTYARCGLFVNVTPIEPGWEGHITLALSNVGQVPVRVYPCEGIAQIMFHVGRSAPDVSYADRNGKYQNADGIQSAKGE